MQHLNLLISHLKRKEAKIVKRTKCLKRWRWRKLQRVLDKLKELGKIEAHLSEVSASLASIEEKVSRLDEDVQDLKQKTNRVEKKAVRI